MTRSEYTHRSIVAVVIGACALVAELVPSTELSKVIALFGLVLLYCVSMNVAMVRRYGWLLQRRRPHRPIDLLGIGLGLAIGAVATVVVISGPVDMHIANLCLYGACTFTAMGELSTLQEVAIAERPSVEAPVVPDASA